MRKGTWIKREDGSRIPATKQPDGTLKPVPTDEPPRYYVDDSKKSVGGDE